MAHSLYSPTIEIPANEATDRSWVRTNSKGEQVAVVANPHYIPTPPISVDDIDLPGFAPCGRRL